MYLCHLRLCLRAIQVAVVRYCCVLFVCDYIASYSSFLLLMLWHLGWFQFGADKWCPCPQ